MKIFGDANSVTIVIKYLWGWYGKDGVSKTDEFSEKFQKGGGVIFNPKNYIADFGHLNRAF